MRGQGKLATVGYWSHLQSVASGKRCWWLVVIGNACVWLVASKQNTLRFSCTATPPPILSYALRSKFSTSRDFTGPTEIFLVVCNWKFFVTCRSWSLVSFVKDFPLVAGGGYWSLVPHTKATGFSSVSTFYAILRPTFWALQHGGKRSRVQILSFLIVLFRTFQRRPSEV